LELEQKARRKVIPKVGGAFVMSDFLVDEAQLAGRHD